MAKFNVNSFLNSIPSSTELTEAAGEQHKKKDIRFISVYDLIPSEDNFYSIEQINELKMSIELAGEVKQNLIVVPLPGGNFKVIAGHRRRLASISLVEEGKTEYELVPCDVETVEEDSELQKLKEELLIIVTNSQREKTDYDKMMEVQKLKNILEKYKAKEKIPGRMRELLARILNTSTTQVERMESISAKLTPEFKEELKEQKVNISTAYELSTLPPEEQQQAYQEYNDKGSISVSEVKERKNKLQLDKSPKTKQTTITTVTEEVTEQEPEQLTPDRLLNVYVCSAYSGEDEDYQKAIKYCKYVIAQGHIPFSNIVMLHRLLDGSHYEQMLKMLQVGFEMIKIVEEVWIFEEDGEITQDMLHQKELAKQQGKKILQIGGICEDG